MIKEYLMTGGLTHIHSELSKDGRYSIDQIGQYVEKFLRSEYFVVNDHLTSQYKGKMYSQEESSSRVNKMISAVREYNRNHSSPRCISGIEVNIKPAGIDIPDNVLEEIDFVIGSRHFPWGEEGPFEIESNLVSAMTNPHIDAIGHIDQYSAEGVDWRKIIRIARETSTIIEINLDRPPSDEILNLLAEYRNYVTLGLDFHSFSGFKKIGKKSDDTDQDILLQPGYNDIKRITTILKLLERTEISPSQVVNLKSYQEFINFLKTTKNDRHI